MKCKALRGFYLADKPVAKGSTVEVPDQLVRQLELTGKIERAPAAEKKPDADKPVKSAPMTTASAPAIVPGAAATQKDTKP